LAVLEEAGWVTLDGDTIQITVPAPQFEEQARSLAGRFVTLRTQDGRRLDRLGEYVDAKECRAIFLRRYFGEEAGEPCGLCDICRGAPERPPTFWQPIARPERGNKKRRKRRRRRGRGRGGAPQVGIQPGTKSPPDQVESGPRRRCCNPCRLRRNSPTACGFAREAQPTLGDDVALDVGCAAGDQVAE
jgi:hypothetical protein